MFFFCLPSKLNVLIIRTWLCLYKVWIIYVLRIIKFLLYLVSVFSCNLNPLFPPSYLRFLSCSGASDMRDRYYDILICSYCFPIEILLGYTDLWFFVCLLIRKPISPLVSLFILYEPELVLFSWRTVLDTLCCFSKETLFKYRNSYK